MPARILLVDDDADFRGELKDYLHGYDVVEAADGAEALAILMRPNEIDLVILDVMMPGMQGTEVLREMKKTDPGLGIIMLTGFGSKDVAVEALKGHADDFVEKSLDIGRLGEVIERLLDESCRRVSRRGGDERSKVEHAKEFVRRNCYRSTHLADAARAVSLSPKYLSRIFRQHAGVGFAAYRQQIAVAEGKKLLRTSGMTVGDIGDRLGYANPESFVRVFRKLTGLTPSQYRKSVSGRRKGKKR